MNITIGNPSNWKNSTTRYVVALGAAAIALGIAVAGVISQPSTSPKAGVQPAAVPQVRPFTDVEYAGVGLAYAAPSLARDAVADNAAFFNGMALAYETANPVAAAPALAPSGYVDLEAAFDALTLAYETARLTAPQHP